MDARASIDQPDVWGYTPLSAAAEEGKLEVVKILCRKRANVSLDLQQISGIFFFGGQKSYWIHQVTRRSPQ